MKTAPRASRVNTASRVATGVTAPRVVTVARVKTVATDLPVLSASRAATWPMALHLLLRCVPTKASRSNSSNSSNNKGALFLIAAGAGATSAGGRFDYEVY